MSRLILAFALLAVAAALWLKAHAPETAYLDTARSTGWIVPGLVKNAGASTPLPTHVTFVRTIEVATPLARPALEIRALGAYEATLDGVSIGARPADDTWREIRRLPLPALPAGTHVLVVTATRSSGPPALWARLLDDSGTTTLRTDTSWTYTINGSSSAPARSAENPWIGEGFDTDGLERTVVWGMPALTLGVAAAALLCLLLARWTASRSPPLSPGAPRWALAALAVVWVVLLARATGELSPSAGFDTEGHIEYIDWLLAKQSLPYPTDGWQMYHPPLYYVIAAGWLSLFGAVADSVDGVRLLRALNIVLAVAFLVAASAAAKRLLAGRAATTTLAIVFLSTAPAAFYMFAFVTNENLCTLAASVLFLLLAGLRGRRAVSLPAAAALGAVLGVAVLTKAAALLLLIPVTGAYLLRAVAQARAGHAASARRALAALGVALLTALLVSGWHFAMIQARFGKPLVGNWDPASGQLWWQSPGFLTWGSYLPDAGAFVRPFYAGFESVWSGFLTTWSADALGAGYPHVNTRPPWNYELTPVSIVLSLVFAALVVGGIASRVRRRGLRMPRLDACLLAMVVATATLLVGMTLTVPAYSAAKAFYGLVAIVPCAVFAARGARRVWGRATDRAVPAALLAAPWVVVLIGMFLILPRAENATLHALQLNADGERGAAIERLEESLRDRPDDMNTRVVLATLLFREGSDAPRVRALIDAEGLERQLQADRLRPTPALSRRVDLLGQLACLSGRHADGVALARRAVSLAPGRTGFWRQGIDALVTAGDVEGAIAFAQEAILWHPWTPDFQQRIGELCDRVGRHEEAERYRRLARELTPDDRAGI